LFAERQYGGFDEKSQYHDLESGPESETAHAKPSARRHLEVRNGEFFVPEEQLLKRQQERSFFETCCVGGQDPRHTLYRSNALKSTKYEVWNFLPLNLFEQLAPWLKPANFYFLCIAVLQCIDEISTTQGQPSILLPLMFVITVTATKDAYEDWGRAKQDRVKNESLYWVHRDRRWVKIHAKNLHVGDIIKVEEGGRIPADVLLVGSGIDNGTHAFIDTKDLDGETNLKPKTVPNHILSVLREKWRTLDMLHMTLNCDGSSGVMNEWHAELTVLDHHGKPHTSQLTLDSLVLSDCVLRNTPWILGFVVYTGDDTKIRKNMEAQMRNRVDKQSSVFRLTKKLFLCMAALQLCLCLAAGIFAGIKHSYLSNHAWYLDASQPAGAYAFYRFWTWFIICKDFVPISLYVSLEMVQFWQAMFMNWDHEMAAWQGGEWMFARAQSSKLNEELSQVHTIFSDKTGTLTQNSMQFKKCLVVGRATSNSTSNSNDSNNISSNDNDSNSNDHSEDSAAPSSSSSSSSSSASSSLARVIQYGQGSTEAGVIRKAKNSGQNISQALAEFAEQQARNKPSASHPHVDFDEVQRLQQVLAYAGDREQRREQQERKESERRWKVNERETKDEAKEGVVDEEEDKRRMGLEAREFLYALALNNSVFPKPMREGDSDEEQSVDLSDPRNGVKMQMDSSSPDEKALAFFAQLMGFELYNRSSGRIRIRMLEQGSAPYFEDFENVCLIDFSSKRKRMTVIVRPLNARGEPDGRLWVFVKGADSFVKPLFEHKDATPEEQAFAASAWEQSYERLVEFGGESLRTLVLGSSEMDPDWWFDPQNGWKAKYEAAKRNQGPTEKGHVDGSCGSECRLCAVEEAIEQSAKLALCGATAIEDKLQEGVPATLKNLLEAGIKVWVLTGDNVSTAINIGISCNLLEADMEGEGRLFQFDKDAASTLAIQAKIKVSLFLCLCLSV